MNDDQSRLDARALSRGRVLVLGDSITQAGGYVSLVSYYLQREFPTLSFDIVNCGLSSETVSGLSEPDHQTRYGFARPCLHERLQRVLERVQPSWVFACYGMNDGIGMTLDGERTSAFTRGLSAMVDQCTAAGAQVMLLTPPVFDAQAHADAGAHHDYDDVLDAFAQWELTSLLPVARVIDVHGAMRRYLDEQRLENPGFSFAEDGVHPEALGHLVIAQVVLDATNAAGPGTDLPGELTRVMADPMYQAVADHTERRARAWMNYVGYERETVMTPGSEQDLMTAEGQVEALQATIDAMRKVLK